MILKELEQQENELHKQLLENVQKQREINLNMFLEKHKIKIGDTIEFKDVNKIKRGVINRADYNGSKVSSLFVLLLNSNGKPGLREVRLWTWSLETIKVIE